MTFANVSQELRALGIVIRARNTAGEFRVNFYSGDEATAYYTPDLEDALNTGLAMASHAQRQQAADAIASEDA